MAAFAVRNVILKADGSAIPGVVVLITLRPEQSYRTSDKAEFIGPLQTTTDSVGLWTVNLEDNLNVSPSGSYYEINEKIPNLYGGAKIWKIRVAGAGGKVPDLVVP